MTPIHRMLTCAALAPALLGQEPTLQLHPADALRRDPSTLGGQLGTRSDSVGVVAQFARRFVRPGLRASEEIESLGDRTLVALARPEQHAWLRQFIALNRDMDQQLIDVQCRFVEMTPAAYRKLAAPLFNDRGPERRHAVLQPSEKTDRFLAGLSKFRGVNVVQSPRLTSFAAQRANISVLSQTSYVKDFVPQFDAAGKLHKVEPVVDVTQDGMVLDVAGALVRPNVLGLELRALIAVLARPIKAVDIRFEGLEGVYKIQAPQVKVDEVRSDVEIPVGATVVFALPRENGHLLVLVTAHCMKLEDLNPKEDR